MKQEKERSATTGFSAVAPAQRHRNGCKWGKYSLRSDYVGHQLNHISGGYPLVLSLLFSQCLSLLCIVFLLCFCFLFVDASSVNKKLHGFTGNIILRRWGHPAQIIQDRLSEFDGGLKNCGFNAGLGFLCGE